MRYFSQRENDTEIIAISLILYIRVRTHDIWLCNLEERVIKNRATESWKNRQEK